ncbi:DUF397 domain-containing protein [Nocardia sp. CA-135398]|uniref:DUF397 domain-containing protein n=1 Tax=Nocardia sp. CA-135398 TaxID=3239977 RepID=UPI003D9A07B7
MINAGTAARSGWFKSSFSKDANSCVEVLFAPDGMVHLRDSKYDGIRAQQPVIKIPRHSWSTFQAVAAGRIEAGGEYDIPEVVYDPDSGNTTLRDIRAVDIVIELVFTKREWEAFTAGIRAAEFAAV